ncbi:MAG: SEC-C metal-binding domain-containing protein [Pseudomonadota bacterium]
MNLSPERKDYTEIDELLRIAVGCALATTDFEAALKSYRKLLPMVAPSLVAQMPPHEDAQRALAYSTLREVWNRVPRPDHDWRPRPLPKPERNGPCPCGSGHKYKQCCGPLAGASPFGGEGLSLLSYVLERFPMAQYKNLPFNKLSAEELGHVASQWMEQGRYDQAVQLLKPLLADPAKLDARHEYAFDMLCDAYLDLGHPVKRMRLAESVMQTPDRVLKSAAMHRRCTMLADNGEYPAAWKLFKEAQRVDPDNPSLAHLEVVLLISQGDVGEAQERARFWAMRLKKLGYGGEKIVDLMEEIAKDPRAFIEAMDLGANIEELDEDIEELDDQSLLQLVSLVEVLPAPACHYRLQPRAGDAGPLEADAELVAIETGWRDVFMAGDDPDGDGGNPWADTTWLDWLAGHPLAWHSFVILEDLLMSIGDVPVDDGHLDDQLDALEDALLDRALALLRLNLGENEADACKLEWGWIENRPALRLLGQAIDLSGDTAEELPLLEWLVLTLNPNDNQGLRERLVHVYAGSGRAADALAVCERYPNDMLGAMIYGRVLALHLLGRRSDAVAALAEAMKRSPRIARMLTAKKPRMPKLQPGLTTLGGEDEAWYYRQSWRGVWESTGALDWLRQVTDVKA